jgi:hypothetical protein
MFDQRTFQIRDDEVGSLEILEQIAKEAPSVTALEIRDISADWAEVATNQDC